MKIPDNTIIQCVDLRVKDLEKSLYFYSYLLGFIEIRKTDKEAILSAGGNEPYILKLVENKTAKFAHRDNTGLYHIAILLPSRKELARVFIRLFNNKVKFHGFSDHLVSEAIYFLDPDENGIELYVDKPKELWKWNNGEVEMATLPLNLNDITKELDDKDVWNGIHPDTRIGHIHLKVSSIAKAEQFYSGVIGFNITTASYPGALFMAAGGYHHHVGANVWHSRNSSPPPENSLGMIGFTIKVPDTEYMKLIEQSAIDLKIEIEKPSSNELLLKDFDSNKIRLTL